MRALVAALFGLAALSPATAQAATGSISGTVTDASTHAPIGGISVCTESEDGESWGCDQTLSNGTYQITGLEAETYKVEFWPEEHNYVYQYYDGKSSWSEADPVVVGMGATTGIDAELVHAAGIEGTVTRISDGSPVEGIEVCAWKTVWGFGSCEWTAADGTYSISNLDPGEYVVEFWAGGSGQNLALQYYDHKDRSSKADPVALVAGETKTGVDAALAAGATIAGNVTSAATGMPLKSIHVCSIDALSVQLWICTRTDSLGNYTLPFHSGGEYKVAFSLEFREWFGNEVMPENDGYPTQFWNNQPTLAAANVIPLSSGGFAAGIDARLGSPAVVSPALTPLALSAPAPARRHRCRRGYRRKLFHGKRRCVKIHHRHRHRKGNRLRLTRPGRAELMALRLLSR